MKNEIVIPIFNNEYKVIFCWGEPKEIKKTLKKYYYPMEIIHSDCFAGRGACFHWDEVHPIIAMPCFPKTPDEIGTLAHEAVHAIQDIFEKIGEHYPGNEIFAHSVGAIVRKVMATNV